MHKKSYLLTILIALSTPHAADDQGLTARESGSVASQSPLSSTESFSYLVRPNIPTALEPYVQETSTPGNFRIYVTFTQYEAFKDLIQASGLSFVILSDEAQDLPRDPSQTSAVSTVLVLQSQESAMSTDCSGSSQGPTESPTQSPTQSSTTSVDSLSTKWD